jgi:uncharacterized protein (DUF305 family)
MITQSNVFFTLIGGIVGVLSMWGMMTYTELGMERLRDVDAALDHNMQMRMEARKIEAERAAAGTHTMPDGTVMHNTAPMAGAAQADHMNMSMNDMARMLEGKSGDALDKEFLAGMIPHHEVAVVMAEQLKKGTKRPELLKMSQDIIDAQTREIEMMKQWQKEWFVK